jgi:hypothetical protein
MYITPVSGDKAVTITLWIGAAVGAWVLAQRARASMPTLSVPDVINPFSDQNAVYLAANGLVSGVTGRPETVGGILAEAFDPATQEVNRQLGTGATPRGGYWDQFNEASSY